MNKLRYFLKLTSTLKKFHSCLLPLWSYSKLSNELWKKTEWDLPQTLWHYRLQMLQKTLSVIFDHDQHHLVGKEFEGLCTKIHWKWLVFPLNFNTLCLCCWEGSNTVWVDFLIGFYNISYSKCICQGSD